MTLSTGFSEGQWIAAPRFPKEGCRLFFRVSKTSLVSRGGGLSLKPVLCTSFFITREHGPPPSSSSIVITDLEGRRCDQLPAPDQ